MKGSRQSYAEETGEEHQQNYKPHEALKTGVNAETYKFMRREKSHRGRRKAERRVFREKDTHSETCRVSGGGRASPEGERH